MSERPDDWYEDLLDRENNPDFERPSSIAGDIKDHAIDRAKDKGKDLAKDAGKKLAKEGAKQGAQAGAEAAAGAAGGAAAGGGAAATGATVAATTGVETAGVGVVVGAAIAILGNKKARTVVIFSAVMLALLQVMILITVVLTPIIIVAEVVNSTMETIRNSTVVRGAEMVIDGATGVAGAVGDTYDAVTPWDGAVPFGSTGNYTDNVAVSTPATGVLASTTPTTTTDAQGKVLAATASTPDSRLSKLYAAMRDKGYFKSLYDKYGFRIKSSDRGATYKIYLDKKLIKTVSGVAALKRELNENKKIQSILYRSLQNDLHVFEYTQRITMAEKGMSNYNTAQLFVPGAETAEQPEEISNVRKKSLETQNNPFLPQMTEDLECTTTDCGTWVPDTVATDAGVLTESITKETNYKTKGTLRKLMKDRIAAATEDEKISFWDWYKYVGEIAETAKLEDETAIANNSFIQGTLKTRKEQAGREWMHWRTVVDQYKTGTKMTDESATALFANFEGGAQSKAYRYLSGQTGGTGFRDYEKLNDNQKNIVKTIYEDWQDKNKDIAPIITSALDNGLLEWLANSTGFLSGLFRNIFGPDDGSVTQEAFAEAGFELGSQIMIPICDGSRVGTNFMNCLYAGAEGTSRDIGMSDYGFNGAISKEEYDRTASYMNGVEERIAAEKPLLERLTSLDGASSFARTFFMQATIPLTSNKGVSSIASYLTALPGNAAQLAVSALNPSAHAAEERTRINNVNLAGIKLNSLLNTSLSATLDDPAGTLNSCPVTGEDQENLCRTDETTWLALAAKFDLLPSDDPTFKFTVGSYNILHADAHTDVSNQIGGCTVTPVPRDPTCAKTRSTRQAQIITGQSGTNPPLDIVGLQEVSPGQYRHLKSLLPGYQSIPSSTARMTNNKDGAVAIFWNSTKFAKFDDGKMAAVSNVSSDITQPWVGLQATTGQKIYVTSIHYPTSTFGGDAATIRRASRLTMDWVKSKARDDAIVIVVGDFNDELRQRLHYCIYTEESVLQHANDMSQGDSPQAGCNNPDTPGIDHIYATPRSTLKATGWTHMSRTGIVATASDHEPVYTNLEISSSNGGTEFIIGTYNQKNGLSIEAHNKAVSNILSVPRGGARMDVVGTQETGNPKYQHYKDALSRSNYGVFPDYGGQGGRPCSQNTSIFYNQDKFRFVKGELFQVPRYPDPPTSCGGGEQAKRRSLEGYADGLPSVWANIPITWLQDNATGQTIIVMNTHNVANVAGADGTRPAYSRYVANKIYVEQVRRLKSENPGIPIFFTGDFNEGTGVRTSRNVTYQGKVENLLFCMFAQNGLMKSAAGPEMKCGGYGIGGVDYIYVTPDVKVDWHAEMSREQAASDHPVHYAKVTVAGAESNFRIATFNILHVGDSAFEQQWRTRLPTSIGLLKDNGIVVAGLQEVRPQQHELLTSQSYATDTYDIFPRSSQQPNFSPNPVIWNKSMFTLVEGKTLPIEYDSGHKIDHAVLVHLKDTQGNEFYVLNTHDPANARPGSDQQNALSRLHNTQFYKAYLGDLARQGKPIFLTGDFNAAYTMHGNQKPYNNQAQNLAYCVISSGGVMKNVWDIFENKQYTCPRSKNPDKHGPGIDHIYAANVDGVKKVWSAPDHSNGSDHPTIMSEIKMPWTQAKNGDPPSGTDGWALPLPRSGWESDGQRWLESHYTGSSAWTNGIVAAADLNIGSGDADCGKPVYSMLAGTVVSNPPTYTMQIRSSIGGKSVLITYAHGRNMKQSGSVRAGQQIMTVSDNGNPAYGNMSCHLHLEISYSGRPVCPQDVFPLVARNQSVNLGSLASRVTRYCR